MQQYTFKSPHGTWQVTIKLEKYYNQRYAIRLIDANDYDTIATATVNIPEVYLDKNEVIIKNYAENEGMLHFLQSNRIVGDVKRWVFTGFVRCPVVDLLSLA